MIKFNNKYKSFLRIFNILSFLFILIFVQGCGIGLNRIVTKIGDSSPLKRLTDKISGKIPLSIIAVKGPLQGGTISLYSLDENGKRKATIITGKTEGGFVSLSSPPLDGPVEAEVSGGTYTNEATGKKASLGTFAMRTRLSDLPRDGNTIIISGLTEMAVRYSMSLSGTMAEKIKKANSKVALAAGLTDITSVVGDPTKTPSDQTSNTAKYGIILSGMCKYAETQKVDPSSIITAFSNDMSDGVLDGKKDGNSVKLAGSAIALSADSWQSGLDTAISQFIADKVHNPGFTAATKPSLVANTEIIPPITASALVVSDIAQTTLKISWTDNSFDETGFNIQQSTDDSDWNTIATSAANVSTYDVTDLSAGTLYYFRIIALNTGGKANPSKSVSTTTLAKKSKPIPVTPIPVTPIPVTPTSLPTGATIGSISNLSQTTLTISWTDNSSNETGFKVQKSTDATTWTTIFTTAENVSSYDVTGLTANTLYYFRIISTNSGGDGTPSANLSTTTLSNPPEGATIGSISNLALTSLTLNWTDNSSNETGFKVQKSTDATTWTTIFTTAENVSSYDITGLSGNTNYYFRIISTNAGADGTPSTNLSTTTLPYPPEGATIASISNLAPTCLTVNWTDNSSNETGFKVQKSTDATTWTTITTTAENISSYDVTGLTANTLYYFRVIATNTGGDGTPSASVKNYSFAAGRPTYTDISATTLTVNWVDNSTDEVGFQVQKSNDSGATWTTLTTTAANETCYSVVGLTDNTLYTFRVSAVNSDGNGLISEESTVTTLALPGFADGNGSCGLNHNCSYVAEGLSSPYSDGIYGYAAWSEYGGGLEDQLRIRRYDGTTWTFIDGDDAHGINHNYLEPAGAASMATHGSKLYVAWTEGNHPTFESDSWFGTTSRVARYDGASTWVFVDGNGSINGIEPNGIDGNLTKIVEYNSNLYLIAKEYNHTGWGNKLRIRKYADDGSTWTYVDDGGFEMNYSESIATPVVFDSGSGEKLYIAFNHSGGDMTAAVRVIVYDGTTAAYIDGGTGLNVDSTRSTAFPSMTLYNDNLYVTWTEDHIVTADLNADSIRIKKYDGTSWTTVSPANGLVHNSNFNANRVSILAFNTKLYLSWYENTDTAQQIRLAQYDGSTYSFVDGDGVTGLNRNTGTSAIFSKLFTLGSYLYNVWLEGDHVRAYRN